MLLKVRFLVIQIVQAEQLQIIQVVKFIVMALKLLLELALQQQLQIVDQ